MPAEHAEEGRDVLPQVLLCQLRHRDVRRDVVAADLYLFDVHIQVVGIQVDALEGCVDCKIHCSAWMGHFYIKSYGEQRESSKHTTKLQ